MHLTLFTELPTPRLVGLFDTPQVVEQLARGGCAVSMGLIDLTAERAEIVRRLEESGVPVTAWLLLDEADGYWLNADNADKARARYLETIEWAERERLRLHRIGLDIEFPRADGELLFKEKIKGPWKLFRRRRPVERVRQAEAAYAELVREIRAGGRSVESYHLPHILDERLAGSTLLRRTFGLVDVAVDVEVFMTYSSYLGTAGALVYHPGAQAIGLGVTGGGVHADIPEERARFLTWPKLEHELRAAARHSGEIYVFSLEGCVEQDMLPRLVAFDWQADGAPPLAPAALRKKERERRRLQLLLRGERLWDRVLPARTANHENTKG